MNESSREHFHVDVLVVGGGTGATAAAIQAARRGVKTAIVSEFSWLGGMLTAAGVCAPDGNELHCWQTGLWGAFLQELRSRQSGGLDHAWVSFFTYDPRVGAAIFQDWALALPNLLWKVGDRPQAVLRTGDRIVGVEFERCTIHAKVTIDGTELGDLFAFAEIPHRWGWEVRSIFNEPSAPVELGEPHRREPVQALTWVATLQDYGAGQCAPAVADLPDFDRASYSPDRFAGMWDQHGTSAFLNYGRMPHNRLMLNWPCAGNDYATDLERLIRSPDARQACLAAARSHTLHCVHHIQTHLDRRYGLAPDLYPHTDGTPSGLALQPYLRESRRLVGLRTVCEQDLLPAAQAGGVVAPLPLTETGDQAEAIAIGNYPNDHHYTQFKLQLQPKSMRWGGRNTGTPFALPYRALIPATIDGLLVSDKNLAVSHIANGATRLQPVILAIGQAAGMAAALCVEQNCQPRELSVRSLQVALVTDPIAPSAIVPIFNLPVGSSAWQAAQLVYCNAPETYPLTGYARLSSSFSTSFSGSISAKVDPSVTDPSVTATHESFGEISGESFSENLGESFGEIPAQSGSLAATDFDDHTIATQTTATNSDHSDHQVAPNLKQDLEPKADNNSAINASDLTLSGEFQYLGDQDYRLSISTGEIWRIVTLDSEVDQQLRSLRSGQILSAQGHRNFAGSWFTISKIVSVTV